MTLVWHVAKIGVAWLVPGLFFLILGAAIWFVVGIVVWLGCYKDGQRLRAGRRFRIVYQWSSHGEMPAYFVQQPMWWVWGWQPVMRWPSHHCGYMSAEEAQREVHERIRVNARRAARKQVSVVFDSKPAPPVRQPPQPTRGITLKEQV